MCTVYSRISKSAHTLSRGIQRSAQASQLKALGGLHQKDCAALFHKPLQQQKYRVQGVHTRCLRCLCRLASAVGVGWVARRDSLIAENRYWTWTTLPSKKRGRGQNFVKSSLLPISILPTAPRAQQPCMMLPVQGRRTHQEQHRRSRKESSLPFKRSKDGHR